LDDIPLGLLLAALVILLLLSAFFSGSETAMMALNRYRLRHLVRAGHPGAVRADALLRRPDRLIGLVLLGNNFVNILASSIATLIALRLWGDEGIAPVAAALTLVVLLFSEVTPKTLAALRPERIAFPAAYVLGALQAVLWPLLWAINAAANMLLRALGVRPQHAGTDRLSREELRTVLYEGGVHLAPRHRGMLLRIVDLEEVAVADVMVPRGEVVGLDLDDERDTLIERLTAAAHTRLPVFRGSLDHVEGILNVRRVTHLLAEPERLLAELPRHLSEPYFVPERTPLTQQLLKFQTQRQRLALVVDEYGDSVGLITVEDILREIVGGVTEQAPAVAQEIREQADGSYLVDGSVSLRELTRRTGWTLPSDGARTLNGVILEHLQAMPTPATGILLGDHPVEIVQVSGNAVRLARLYPKRRAPAPLPAA
jgi:Mg2+/Co2+ transporter CorB